jgi:hypothetical protein
MSSYTMNPKIKRMKKMNHEGIHMKRTPLEILSLVAAFSALVVIGLSFSHIFGIGILSWIFPDMLEPGPIHFSPRFLILSEIIVPSIALSIVLFFIFRPLRYMLNRERDHGCRPELVLLMNSFIFTALTLQYLESHVQPAGSIKDFLFPISLVLLLFGAVILGVVIIYRYYIDKTTHY